jgi:hypothetical protein
LTRLKLTTLATLTILAILPFAGHAYSQNDISLDMSGGWTRRDWFACEDVSEMSSDRHRMTIATDKSAALYWQVPTMKGPLPIDPNLDWVLECDRPPRGFAQEIADGPETQTLMELSDYRYFTWKWKVTNTIDDRKTIDDRGRIQADGDDFAAKLGITILKKDSNDPRELSYVWTRSLPEEKVIVHERRILFWRFQYHRIVVQSGDADVGKWVSEARDLYADYKRIYPNEEPGKIVKIYVMSDSDNTGSSVAGTFADLAFRKGRPANISPPE